MKSQRTHDILRIKCKYVIFLWYFFLQFLDEIDFGVYNQAFGVYDQAALGLVLRRPSSAYLLCLVRKVIYQYSFTCCFRKEAKTLSVFIFFGHRGTKIVVCNMILLTTWKVYIHTHSGTPCNLFAFGATFCRNIRNFFISIIITCMHIEQTIFREVRWERRVLRTPPLYMVLIKRCLKFDVYFRSNMQRMRDLCA